MPLQLPERSYDEQKNSPTGAACGRINDSGAEAKEGVNSGKLQVKNRKRSLYTMVIGMKNGR